ncbi:MAG: penicillin-binding protein 2 [Puniceicoccales bacterium]|jgi:cell division protein FtsI/penicillin-binding protein 2|nr:penicillin-binding protein 2 [Puniceicoccales bacterium]
MLRSWHHTASRRAFLLSLLVLALYGWIAWKLYFYGILRKKNYRPFVDGTHQVSRGRSARRGAILDRNGTVLALTQPLIEVGVDPFVASPEDRPLWPRLAELLGIGLEDIEAALTRQYILKEGKRTKLRWQKLGTLRGEAAHEALQNLRIRGIYGLRRSERVYPCGHVASHVIGFVNREGLAVSGVERALDFFLRGHEGCLSSECDGRRRELAQFRHFEILPQNGANVLLSLDIFIQNAVEALLDRWEQRHHPQGMSVLVSDATTGELLALGNRPSFDPNAYAQAAPDDLRNRAITDCYEPGSVFKIVPVSLGLEWRVLKPEQIFDCSCESVDFGGRRHPLPRDHRPMGRLSVLEILSRSSNRGVAQIALRLGPRQLHAAAQLFGFGERTGYGFDGEAKGILYPPSRWDALSITRLPMGHALAATPLQVHQAMGVLASGGYLLRPRILGAVVEESGEEILHPSPDIRRRILSPATVRLVRAALSNPEKMLLSGVHCAGKSGTSQKIIGGRYSNEHHIASFSGFFPLENPQVLITVVLDDPQVESGVAWGMRLAFPLFKKLAKRIIRHREIPPSPRNFSAKG